MSAVLLQRPTAPRDLLSAFADWHGDGATRHPAASLADIRTALAEELNGNVSAAAVDAEAERAVCSILEHLATKGECDSTALLRRLLQLVCTAAATEDLSLPATTTESPPQFAIASDPSSPIAPKMPKVTMARFDDTPSDDEADPRSARVGVPSAMECTMTAQAAIGDEEDDGTQTINQYVLLDKIGSGAQGEVHLAMDMEQNEMRAVKIVKRGKAGTGFRAARREQERLQLEREVAIMKSCRHRNVVALYEVIDDPEQNAMYLVMQYVEHGPLVGVQDSGRCDRRVAPGKLIQYARQIVAGLLYLHEHGVVHRDIKPDNILLGANDAVYLADFGMSELFAMDNDSSFFGDGASLESPDGGRVHGTKGTIAFMAPELLTATRSVGADGEAVDVWALGMALYTMLYGRIPWGSTSTLEMMRCVGKCDIDFPPEFDAILTCAEVHVETPAVFASGVERVEALRVLGGNTPCTLEVLDGLKAVIRGMLQRDPRHRTPLPTVKKQLRALAVAAKTNADVPAAVVPTLATTAPPLTPLSRYFAGPISSAQLRPAAWNTTRDRLPEPKTFDGDDDYDHDHDLLDTTTCFSDDSALRRLPHSTNGSVHSTSDAYCGDDVSRNSDVTDAVRPVSSLPCPPSLPPTGAARPPSAAPH